MANLAEIQREPLGRGDLDIRPLHFELGVSRYAEGSVLVRAGNTHVLCAATVEPKVPDWLAGKGRGWVTAEYSMLPRATHTRSKREREKVSGRTQEIQRLIGRALRAVIDPVALGERSVVVDCDVLQADGGTRTASISGACVALIVALEGLRCRGLIGAPAWSDTVAAISVGLREGRLLVDLDYPEDSSCDVDMNIVMTGSGKFVEVQGTAEREPYSRLELDRMVEGASLALGRIRELQAEALLRAGISVERA
jgi:ribonuclease PH